MAMEQMMAFFQSLPPEQQQALMAKIQGGGGGGLPEMPQAPGMAPAPGMAQQPPQQPVDPRMGLPGQGGGSPEAFRDYAGEGAIIGDQQAQAEALRGTPIAQGIHTRNAGFVASNPLSHIARAGKEIMGRMDAKKALQAKKDLSALKTTTQQDIAKSVLERDKKRELAVELRKPSPLEQMATNTNRNEPSFT